ncbi:hypothetical protein BC829DRAFT_405260 [Chytridium lagenaria]|nr:hypothetical protein BC829DRAFT_405260 [Chytridium lagenaria]
MLKKTGMKWALLALLSSAASFDTALGQSTTARSATLQPAPVPSASSSTVQPRVTNVVPSSASETDPVTVPPSITINSPSPSTVPTVFQPVPPQPKASETNITRLTTAVASPSPSSNADSQNSNGSQSGISGRTVGFIIGGVIAGIILLAVGSFAWLDAKTLKARQQALASSALLSTDSASTRSTNSPSTPPPPMPPAALPKPTISIPQRVEMEPAIVSPAPTVTSLTPSMSASMVGVRNQAHYANAYYQQQAQQAAYHNYGATYGAPYGAPQNRYMGPAPATRVMGGDRGFAPNNGYGYYYDTGHAGYNNLNMPAQGQVSYGQIYPQQQFAERFSTDLAPPPGRPQNGNYYR